MEETITLSGKEEDIWAIINDLDETLIAYNNQFHKRVRRIK